MDDIQKNKTLWYSFQRQWVEKEVVEIRWFLHNLEAAIVVFDSNLEPSFILFPHFFMNAFQFHLVANRKFNGRLCDCVSMPCGLRFMARFAEVLLHIKGQ